MEWITEKNLLVDYGPLFISCASFDPKAKRFVAITSLWKNRFCELVRYDICSRSWIECTRTRHFRPPKRVGSASVNVQGSMYIIGGYELSNYYVSSDVRQEACEESLLNFFRHPQWWEHKDTECKVNSNILGPLGDFHRYDTFRGEWNVLISRDSNSKQHQSNNVGSEKTNLDRHKLYWAGDKRHAHTYENVNSDLPQPRAYHTLTHNSFQLYVFGGERQIKSADNSKNTITYYNDIWSYDLKKNLWTLLSPSPVNNKGFNTLSEEDYGLSAWVARHGTKSTLASSDESVLNVDSCGSYLEPTARSGHTTVSYMKNLYMYGGQNSELKTYFNDFWEFDTVSNKWRQIYTLGINPGPRAGHTALVIGHFMCVYGGITAEDKSVIGMTNYKDYNFSDHNCIWFLNLQTFTWQVRTFSGTPPQIARAFGRLYGFFCEGYFWLGGPTGSFSLNDTFVFSKVEITSSILSQSFNEDMLRIDNARYQSNESDYWKLPFKKAESKPKNWWKKKNLVPKQCYMDNIPPTYSNQPLYPVRSSCHDFTPYFPYEQKSNYLYESPCLWLNESDLRQYTLSSSYCYSDPSQAMFIRPSTTESHENNKLDYWKYSWASSSSTAVGCFNSILSQCDKNGYIRLSSNNLLSDKNNTEDSEYIYANNGSSHNNNTNSGSYATNMNQDIMDDSIYENPMHHTSDVAYILNQLINNNSNNNNSTALLPHNSLSTTSSTVVPNNFHMRSSPEIRNTDNDFDNTYIQSKTYELINRNPRNNSMDTFKTQLSNTITDSCLNVITAKSILENVSKLSTNNTENYTDTPIFNDSSNDSSNNNNNNSFYRNNFNNNYAFQYELRNSKNIYFPDSGNTENKSMGEKMKNLLKGSCYTDNDSTNSTDNNSAKLQIIGSLENKNLSNSSSMLNPPTGLSRSPFNSANGVEKFNILSTGGTLDNDGTNDLYCNMRTTTQSPSMSNNDADIRNVSSTEKTVEDITDLPPEMLSDKLCDERQQIKSYIPVIHSGGNLSTTNNNNNTNTPNTTAVTDEGLLYQVTAKLQAEAKRHQEENLILKDAILLLIPYLNTNELTSVLHSMQTANPSKKTPNSIVDLLLECHNY